MKKIYILLSAVLLGSTAMAQVEIREFTGGQAVGNDISGTTVMLLADHAGSYSKSFDVLNVSGSTQNLTIKRTRLDNNPTWGDNLCWSPNPDPNFEGHCYSTNEMDMTTWTTPYSGTVPNQDDAVLLTDFEIDVAGDGTYRYYIMNGSAALDSIDVHLMSTVGVKELDEPLATNVYPNPANNVLKIATTGTEGIVDVRIADVLGKIVYSGEIGTMKTLDISDYKNGVYLVSVSTNGQLIQTRRIVVKH